MKKYEAKKIRNKEEILKIDVRLTGRSDEREGPYTVTKVPFTARSRTKWFVGETVTEGCDVQKRRGFRPVDFTATYTLEGRDCTGERCKIHIVNHTADGRHWKPSLTTDSKALSFLNDLEPVCVYEGRKVGPIIHIYVEQGAETMNRIPIWGKTIPGNSKKSKRDVMEVSPVKLPYLMQFGRMILSATGSKDSPKAKRAIDSFTWHQVIRKGLEKETFEDIPTIDPYPVPGARQAVLVIPGGAYAYKQTDMDGSGKQAEGDLVAAALNARGISAFVLWYRSNPYYAPIPLLDVQRAVRYLRFHAVDYGFDPAQISVIGFSAGGYQALGFANLLRETDQFPADYQPDEIDAVSDEIRTVAAGYPETGFRAIPGGVFALMPGDEARNPEKREAFFRAYELKENIRSADLPQFIHYGTKDTMIRPETVEAYIEAVRRAGGEVSVIQVPGAGHGYGANPKQKNAIFWIDEYANWLEGRDRT